MIRKTRRVTKKVFLELALDNRQWFERNYRPYIIFEEILSPCFNPKIAVIRKKLKRGKIKCIETHTIHAGKACIVFTQTE